MDFKDYYTILGLSKTATEKEIKSAYRKLARKYHPDLNPGNKDSEIKFKEINEANEVLSNAENRAKYDTYGKDWKYGEQFEEAKRQRQQYASESSSTGSFSNNDYSDFFESMFGGRGSSFEQGRQPKFKGQDYNAELNLSLKDVYTDQTQILPVNNQKIRLTIPAGVENGQVIKIKGKGGIGANGGPAGDLFIKFVITNDTPFTREANDLHQTIDIDLYTAILGGEITIDSFTGKLKLQVKPESKNGAKVKLKGKGFPKYKQEGEFGDMIITYQVQTPTNLSEKEKELFKELQKLSNNDRA